MPKHPNQHLTQRQWLYLGFQRKLLCLLNITDVINKNIIIPLIFMLVAWFYLVI